MQRCAVFVDAGYLLVAGGVLYCQGLQDRRYIRCDYPLVAEALRQFADNHSGMKVLRIYWYDGAPNAVPQRDHLAIAALPYVKLRLGRLVHGEQKGVDSLVVRDLMVLARERAIATAYLFGGDEDLREGVAAAQDMGVQVVVIGLRPIPQAQPADTLLHEADEMVVLADALLQPYFASARPAGLPAAQPAVAPPALPGPPAAPVAPAAAAAVGPAPAAVTPTPTVPPTGVPPRQARTTSEIAKDYARTWAGQAAPPEITRIAAYDPFLPLEIDRQLIFFAQRELGPLNDREDIRRELRAAFHEGLREVLAGTQQ